jgi:hypothetical protein
MLKTEKTKTVKRYKLQPGIPLTEQQIKLFTDHYKKHKNFPGSKIPCVITGKLTTAVGPWLRKKVAEFGSAENLLRGYKCRQATKKQKPIVVKVKKKKQTSITKEDGRYDVPKINLSDAPRPLNKTELAKDSRSICLRPDIFIHNGRHCDGCYYYELCENQLKCLPKHIKFEKRQFISTENNKKN